MKIKNNSEIRTVDAFMLKEEGGYQTAFLVVDGIVLKTSVHEKCERIDSVEIHEIADNPMTGMNIKSLLKAKDFTWNKDVQEDIFPTALPMLITKGTAYGMFAGQLTKGEVIS